MSDSETEAESKLRPDSKLEQCLRAAVRDALAAGKEITVNSARERVEQDLELEDGFFKSNSDWKIRSRNIINATVAEPDATQEEAVPAPNTGRKRKAATMEPAKKRKKTKREETPVEEDESEAEDIAVSDRGAKKNGTKKASTKPEPVAQSEEESELSDPPDEAEDKASSKSPSKDEKPAKPAPIEDDDEMSDVIDDAPTKKKRGKKSTSPGATTTSKSKATKPKAAAKPKPDAKTLTADEEEIKRLQGWLLKCGVRKLWHRELAPFESSKEKIRHLKSMLTDVGMTGRFSVEKARGIKESRELAAELEAAKEFNEQWGEDKDEERSSNSGDADQVAKKEEAGTRNKRAKPKGLVVFSDSDDDSS